MVRPPGDLGRYTVNRFCVSFSYDDIRDLVEDRWRRFGFDDLLQEERDYIVLWWLDVEASNGGLDQYFSNSSGDGANLAADSLLRLNAPNAFAVLNDAIDLFGPNGCSTDRDTRNRQMEQITNRSDAFSQLTDRLFDESEDILSMAIDRVGEAYETHNIQKVSARSLRSIVAAALLAGILALILIVAAVALVGP